uniref:Uncharacterized protein n=1 Tax=Ascaris lumbricoides TaxID=6252 RepID=A0A0M3HMP5_ASCLU
MTDNIRDGCSTGDESMQEDECEEIRRILEDMIERRMQLVDMSTVRDGQQHWHDTGIKLLSGSQQRIVGDVVDAEDGSDNGPPKKRRRRKDSGSSDSDEERSRIQQAAVPLNFVRNFK